MSVLGAVMNVPNMNDLKTCMTPAFPSILSMLNDSSTKVRSGVAYVIYRVCEKVPNLIFNSEEEL